MSFALDHHHRVLGFLPEKYVPTLRVIPLVLFLLLSTVEAFSFNGEVVGVLEGSAIEVMRLGKVQRIHLHGLDCPEKGQPYGDEVKPALSAFVFAMEVTVEPRGKDKSGRILADVLLADGTNVNHAMVRDGRCWWSRKFAPSNAELERLELEAREAKKGLWEDSAPIPPWEFRKSHRRRSSGTSNN